MKDVLRGKIMKGSAGLRAKTYNCLKDNMMKIKKKIAQKNKNKT